jgi:hypothetical protein
MPKSEVPGTRSPQSCLFFARDGFEGFEMSEYVEARYAKLVLREAEVAKDDVAPKLVDDLLRDLNSPQKLNSARAQTLTSIRVLAHRLHQPHCFHVREWEAAHQAAEEWCQNAYR